MTQPAQLGNLSRRQHLESEIVTSSFGIGSDFNFEIMDTIAKNGHGSYFFVSIINININIILYYHYY